MSQFVSNMFGHTPLFGNMSSNDTSNPAISLQLFDAFIPGYRPIHNFVLNTFGIDITVIVTLFVTVLGLSKLWNYIYNLIYQFMAKYFMSSVDVNTPDEFLTYLKLWLATQPSIKNSRFLTAELETSKKVREAEEDEEFKSPVNLSNIKFPNFSNQTARMPARYIPAVGSHRFWHNGTFFMLERFVDPYNTDRLNPKEKYTISTFGRSTAATKDLLNICRDHHWEQRTFGTYVYRPAPKELRQHGGNKCWTDMARRPSRPIDTVILDTKRKTELILDMLEYLHPTTTRWYSDRGIPYRRGYLLHGPPGTGKTSLTFALAGVFGLPLYFISLLEKDFAEEDLAQLFNNLPTQCIVLLEDIDSAGLDRNEDGNGVSRKEGSPRGISLSGLLNAIDGVASQEGRVLIMTTNKPESLDSALLRPGRVDLQVAFTNTTNEQTKELFVRMYLDYPGSRRLKDETSGTTKLVSVPLIGSKREAPRVRKTAKDTMVEAAYGYPERTLEECAIEFAEIVPDDKFSPAEIQGFLVKRKKQPQKACEEARPWVESMLRHKEMGKKVLDMQ